MIIIHLTTKTNKMHKRKVSNINQLTWVHDPIIKSIFVFLKRKIPNWCKNLKPCSFFNHKRKGVDKLWVNLLFLDISTSRNLLIVRTRGMSPKTKIYPPPTLVHYRSTPRIMVINLGVPTIFTHVHSRISIFSTIDDSCKNICQKICQ